jgi:hypothetical protein
MLRRELEAARAAWIAEATDPHERDGRERSDFLAYRDAGGRVADFHALRHSFITRLVKAGVKPKDAQTLARHSTITLTKDRYTHVGLHDTAAAVESLPGIPGTDPGSELAVLRATGTDGPSGAPAYVPPDVPAGGFRRGGRERTGEETDGPAVEASTGPRTLKFKAIEGNRGESRSGEGGIRTLGTVARTPVFETGPFNHSGTSPLRHDLA